MPSVGLSVLALGPLGRTLRLKRSTLGIFVAAALAACSSRPSETTSSGSGGATSSSSSTTSGSTGGASTTSSTGTTTSSSGAGGGTGGTGGVISTLPNDLGTIPILDEPNVPCVSKAASPITVYPAGMSPAAFDRLEQVGTVWLASGTTANGFVMFEADGSNASPGLTKAGDTANVAGTTGPRLAIAGITAGNVQLQEYDSLGAPFVSGLALGATDGVRLGIGGWFGDAVVVYQDLGEVRVAGVNEFGDYTPPFTVGNGVLGTSLFSAVAPAQVGFAVAWTHESTQFKAETTLAFTTTEGPVGLPIKVAQSTRAHTLVRLVRSTSGYVLLFNGQDETSGVYVLPLEPDGTRLFSGRRLLGAKRGWDIAALGDKLGVVATLDDDTLAFRPLDAHGNVAGPWVCLGNPSSAANHMAGIAPLGFGNGYAIIARGDGGSEVLLNVDVLGTGVP